MRGKMIEFEGLDYSFKETNTKRLLKYIKENITEKVQLISFPNYDSKSSMFVKSYLSGFYGKASEVDPYQATVCYAMDRYQTMIEEDIKLKLEDGWIIILDRYVGSNLIFQTSKLVEISLSEVDKFIDWTIDFEYNKLGLPKEDIVIYMDMPIDVSHKLMLERKLKAGTSTDGHESNYKFMKQVETAAKNAIIPKLGYNVIKCVDEENNIRTEEEIFDDILSILKLK